MSDEEQYINSMQPSWREENRMQNCKAESELAPSAGYGSAEHRLIQELQLKADMFDYLCWLEHREQVDKFGDDGPDFLCLARDGTTCWGKDYATAVRVAMEHDKGIQDAAESQSHNTKGQA